MQTRTSTVGLILGSRLSMINHSNKLPKKQQIKNNDIVWQARNFFFLDLKRLK